MYFELSKELIFDLSKENYDQLSILIDSYKYGNHIIAFERRSLAQSLDEYFSKNEEKQKIIRNIYSNHQDNKSLKKILKTYVIVKSPTSNFLKYIENNVKIFEVPLSYFNHQLLCPTLITENMSDGIFYKGLVSRIQENGIFNIPKNILFNCMNDGAGGSQIVPIFNYKITSEKRIAFSICDSDKKEQDAPLGENAKQLQKTYDNLSQDEAICSIFILNVREKENLIPPSYYYNHNNFKHKEGLHELSKLEKNDISEEKIKYLKLSETCDQTLSYFNNELGFSMTHADYTIGKKGLGIIAKEFIYTDSFIQEVIQEKCERIEEGKYLTQYGNFFDNLPEYLYEEYKFIADFFLDWACAHPIPRIAY